MDHSGEEHASDDTLELYSLGALPSEQTEAFEEHLLICPSCQQRQEETDVYVKAMRSATAQLALERRQPPSDREPVAVRWRWFSPVPLVAAGALLALGIFVVDRAFRPGLPAPTPTVVLLQTQRTGEAAGAAPAGRDLALQLDAAGLPTHPAYGVQMVNSTGGPAGQAAATRRDAVLRVAGRHRFAAGSYWVRVFDPGGTLLREYSLRVE